MDVILYLKTFSNITNIPVCIYANGEYIYLENSDYQIINNKIYSYILKQEDEFLWMNGWLLFCKLKYEEKTIILGPCMSYIPTDMRSMFVLLSSKMFLSNEEVQIAYNSKLFGKRIYEYTYFKECINLVSLGLLGKEYDKTLQETFEHGIVNPEENITENIEIEWSNQNLKYVEEMKYIIKNGLIEELKELFKNEQHAPYGTLGPNELRHYKNSMMIHIYIVRCAAHEGGLDEDLGIRLSEAYAQQCEAAQSIYELVKISQKLRMDFCSRIQKMQVFSCDSLTITKAMQYIHEHRMEKLNAKVIADALDISSSYLCSEFKKETGMSIVLFIQKEKIRLAKKMMLFTEYSLSEISSYLSFSSQSYFQSLFKKMEGITPTEFRSSKNYELRDTRWKKSESEHS